MAFISFSNSCIVLNKNVTLLGGNNSDISEFINFDLSAYISYEVNKQFSYNIVNSSYNLLIAVDDLLISCGMSINLRQDSIIRIPGFPIIRFSFLSPFTPPPIFRVLVPDFPPPPILSNFQSSTMQPIGVLTSPITVVSSPTISMSSPSIVSSHPFSFKYQIIYICIFFNITIAYPLHRNPFIQINGKFLIHNMGLSFQLPTPIWLYLHVLPLLVCRSMNSLQICQSLLFPMIQIKNNEKTSLFS